MTLSECINIKDFAAYYGVSMSTVNRWKEIGANVSDESEINYLKDKKKLRECLAEYREGARARTGEAVEGSRARTHEGEYTLKDSLATLVRMEKLLADEFEKAANASARRIVQKDFLDVKAARLDLELKIHEVERRASESLPLHEVKAEWFGLLKRYREELEAIPVKFSPFLVHKEEWQIQDILRKLVAQLIERHLLEV